jgi:hypothetical protein
VIEDQPRVLIMSAKESLPVAEEAQRYFQRHHYEVEIWSHIFPLGRAYLNTRNFENTLRELTPNAQEVRFFDFTVLD